MMINFQQFFSEKKFFSSKQNLSQWTATEGKRRKLYKNLWSIVTNWGCVILVFCKQIFAIEFQIPLAGETEKYCRLKSCHHKKVKGFTASVILSLHKSTPSWRVNAIRLLFKKKKRYRKQSYKIYVLRGTARVFLWK